MKKVQDNQNVSLENTEKNAESSKERNRRVTVDYNISHGINMAYRHTHIQYEYLFIRQGRVTIENNGSKITVNGPCMIIHKPFTLHRAFTDGNVTYERYIIYFDQAVISELEPWISKLRKVTSDSISIMQFDDGISERITSVCSKLLETYRSGKYRRCELLLAMLTDVICESSKDSITYQSSVENKYVAEAMNYIGEHYSENILIEELARRLFVSRAKLISDFKKYNGITIKQYIQLTRINYAKLMLSSGSSITETAQSCGFCDDSHFVYTFRKLVGVTPKTYVTDSGSTNE